MLQNKQTATDVELGKFAVAYYPIDTNPTVINHYQSYSGDYDNDFETERLKAGSLPCVIPSAPSLCLVVGIEHPRQITSKRKI